MRMVSLPYEEIISAVSKRKDLLNDITVPRLVDFDLWAGNVLLDKKDGAWYISAIIDFERAFFGDPFADFIAAVELYTEIGRETQFLEGYRTVDKEFQVTEHDRERMKLYSLYLNTIMAVETYRFEENYGKMMQEYCSRNIDSVHARHLIWFPYQSDILACACMEHSVLHRRLYILRLDVRRRRGHDRQEQ